MEDRRLLNLNRVLELLQKQYSSKFYIIMRCVKEGNLLKNKVFITIFDEIVAVTHEENCDLYKVSYNFNNSFWYKYVGKDGHGVAFSPLFDEDDVIEISGENYIHEDIIKEWSIFTTEEFKMLN